jgi:CheY-like chemotaxis protein
MHFPLYHRPNALVFLDDDASYLDMLAMVMPRDWIVRLFTHVDDCITHIQQECDLWEADVWLHQQMADGPRTGKPVIPELLEYWKANPHRYGLTQCSVVDYAMPAMTGLEFLKKIPVFPTHRVLLTGKADEAVAVTAFNDGLIGRFVPKQHPDIGKHLTQVLTEQHQKSMGFHEAIWRNALKKTQYAALQEQTVQIDLQRIVREKKWVEYVVVPAPFGILALDQHAQAHWLQLEMRSDLNSAADLAHATGHSEAVTQKIREGYHFINSELLMALGREKGVRTELTFELGISKGLLGAFFPLPTKASYGQGYEQFLSLQPPRTVTGDSKI